MATHKHYTDDKQVQRQSPVQDTTMQPLRLGSLRQSAGECCCAAASAAAFQVPHRFADQPSQKPLPGSLSFLITWRWHGGMRVSNGCHWMALHTTDLSTAQRHKQAWCALASAGPQQISSLLCHRCTASHLLLQRRVAAVGSPIRRRLGVGVGQSGCRRTSLVGSANVQRGSTLHLH